MKTTAQLSTELSTSPNGILGDYKPWRRATGEAGNIILNPLAKTANRKKCRYHQQSDFEVIETDKGLVNDEDHFEHFIQSNVCRQEPDYIYRCAKGFVWGESSQNNFYKMISCGKEWCRDCGAMHSIPHDRRISRHLTKFLALHQAKLQIQYLVITIPPELRKFYRSHQALQKFRRYWVEKLKREGNGEKWQFGISRYHYAGEDGFNWHPHLNILTVGGFIPLKELREMRAELSRWFKMQHNLDYNPKPNIYTSWTSDADKVKHWLSYIMRATQIIYNKTSADIIHGFRNVAPWKNKDFDLPEYKAPLESKPEDLEKLAIDEGFDLLPDGTKEKIIWRMKYSLVKKRMVPELVPIEQTRLDDLTLIKRGFWKESKYKAPPPDPVPENSFCPF